jgi:hypothetical protein
MENIAENIELLYQKVEKYSKTSFELLQLSTINKTSDILSSLAVVIALSILLAMFTLFMNIGISLYLGDLLHNYVLGFIIVAVCYLLIGIIIYLFRKSLIKTPIDNLIVSKFLKDNPEAIPTAKPNSST